jgi:hypothetical protein
MMVTSVERDAVEVVRSATSKSKAGPRAGQCGWYTRTESQSASGEQRESRREAAVARARQEPPGTHAGGSNRRRAVRPGAGARAATRRPSSNAGVDVPVMGEPVAGC